MPNFNHENWGRLWTSREDSWLRSLYPNYALIGRRVVRTREAIRCRARKLRLPRLRRHHFWSVEEKLRLRRLWKPGTKREVIIEAFPFASFGAIQSAAIRMGLRKGKLALKEVDDPIFNAVRKRCRHLRLSFLDLDAMCGFRKNYFYSRKIKQKASAPQLCAAIKALGGRRLRNGTIEWI